LQAIALVESGRRDPITGATAPWPWTVNAGGIGRFYDTRQDAEDAVRDLQQHGVRSIDVGCLQINLMYHPDAFATLDDAFDPGENAAYAARFLNALYRQTGNWALAAADYHSQTPEVGADYARRVAALWPDAVQYGAQVVPVAATAPTGPFLITLPPGDAPATITPLAKPAHALMNWLHAPNG
jgi:hypothetical protein